MRKAWFKPKKFGWGWAPISWEGWLVTIVFVFLLIMAAYQVGAGPGSVGEKIAGILIIDIPTVIIMCVIAYLRTEKKDSTNKEQ